MNRHYIKSYMAITKTLYNKNSLKWKRTLPKSLSDFSARPLIMKLCGNVKDKSILDLGCGEGYIERLLIKKNPKNIFGIDISSKMINLAKQQMNNDRVVFEVGNINELRFKKNTFDLVLAVFLYNYTSIKEMRNSMKEIYKVLKPNGIFIFSVPHPFLPFIKNNENSGLKFNIKNNNYFEGRNKNFDGYIECVDKSTLPVKMNHKHLSDYLNILKETGFDKIPEMHEITIKKNQFNNKIINKNIGIPLHIIFKANK